MWRDVFNLHVRWPVAWPERIVSDLSLGYLEAGSAWEKKLKFLLSVEDTEIPEADHCRDGDDNYHTHTGPNCVYLEIIPNELSCLHNATFNR